MNPSSAMRTTLLAAGLAALTVLCAAQTSFVGQDTNGNQVTCVNGTCKNSLDHDCDLMTVSCWDWRCRNVPSRFLCALTDACLTVVCYDPNAVPAADATPTSAPVRNENVFDFDNCDGTRKRRELRCMDEKQRKTFVKAFKGAADAGVIDDFTQMFDTNVWEATGGAKFFPWVRYYLRRLENLLREVEPKFKALPYWDFTADSDDIALSDIFTIKHGMSRPRKNKCVAKQPWSNYYPTYPEEHCIMRGFAAGAANKTDKIDGAWGLQNLVEHARNYSEFADVAEYVWHRVREAVGGEMSKRIGPNDPLFYLLLANMDRYWAMRQARDGVEAWEYNGNHRDGETRIDDELAAFGGKKVSGVMETACITYADSCMAYANPSAMPKMLSDEYLEENVLPTDRTRRIEGFLQATLSNSHDEQ